jgi:MFS family permease
MASGIKTTLDMAGYSCLPLLMGFLITAEDADPTLSVLVIIGLLVLFALITLLFTRERSTASPQQKSQFDWKELWKSVFHFKAEGDKGYWRLIFSRFLYLVGVYGFQSFAQYFIRDKFPEQDPIQFTQFVMGSFVIVLIIFSLLSGKWSNRFGQKRLQISPPLHRGGGGAAGDLCRYTLPVDRLWQHPWRGIGHLFSHQLGAGQPDGSTGRRGEIHGAYQPGHGRFPAVARLEGPMTDLLNNAAPANGGAGRPSLPFPRS